jgi:hypothetical protein
LEAINGTHSTRSRERINGGCQTHSIRRRRLGTPQPACHLDAELVALESRDLAGDVLSAAVPKLPTLLDSSFRNRWTCLEGSMNRQAEADIRAERYVLCDTLLGVSVQPNHCQSRSRHRPRRMYRCTSANPASTQLHTLPQNYEMLDPFAARHVCVDSGGRIDRLHSSRLRVFRPAAPASVRTCPALRSYGLK